MTERATLETPTPVRRSRQSRSDGALTIRELLSYRLHVVANLLSRGAAMRYKREFGVSLWEWRSVALLGGAQVPLSLNDLAAAAGLDKSQMSRVVAGLVGRGIVARGADDTDRRGVKLKLSRTGDKLYAGLIRAAAERNDAFLACLRASERECLEGALRKLGDQARTFIQQEKVLAGRKRKR